MRKLYIKLFLFLYVALF